MTRNDSGWNALGLAIGHATDERGATGCTVIRGIDSSFRCAAHLLGRASGTRELAVCQPEHLTDRVDAVLLTGGSAYGLDSAAGVMRWMEERGRGHAIGSGVVPIVPAATIFDLAPLGLFSARPTPEMAYAACDSALSDVVEEGSIGAGTGATVGKITGPAFAMKGGIGCGHAYNNTVSASAIVVTNALGDVRDAHGAIIAGARSAGGAFADGENVLRTSPRSVTPVGNTTIALVAVNASLTKVQLAQIAVATSAAFFRRITPCGTSFDGDVIFAACPPTGIAAPMPVVEALAVAAMEQAIERSVRAARGRDGIPGLGDEHAAG
ncbi:MAG: P1 family peptidase [Phycisphaerae bacterium]|nr:P1 family peptidase [Gemmatimonadaceae bacterium]